MIRGFAAFIWEKTSAIHDAGKRLQNTGDRMQNAVSSMENIGDRMHNTVRSPLLIAYSLPLFLQPSNPPTL